MGRDAEETAAQAAELSVQASDRRAREADHRAAAIVNDAEGDEHRSAASSNDVESDRHRRQADDHRDAAAELDQRIETLLERQDMEFAAELEDDEQQLSSDVAERRLVRRQGPADG